jgi:hypothetical protein
MSKTVTGSRALVYVGTSLVGIFESISVSNTTSTEAIHILGRFTPDEIAITAREAVNVSCSGFRVAGSGKNVLPKVPRVQDLLNFPPFTITIVDRQMVGGQTTPTVLETILNCTPTTDNVNYNAKATSKISINYTGTIASSEGGTDTESAGAASLPE